MKFKKRWQTFLYLIDVCIIVVPLFFISLHIQPFEEGISNHLFDAFERLVALLIFHQLIAFIFSRNTLDLEKDSLLSYISTLELMILYAETKQSTLKDGIMENINRLLAPGTLIKAEVKDNLNKLNTIVKSNDFSEATLVKLKASLIHANHCYEMCDFAWQKTILLKHFK